MSANELPPRPEPDAFRTRYRSEPGMIGHYPWSYVDAGRKKALNASCEYEDLFGEEKVDTLVAAARAPLLARIAEFEATLRAVDSRMRDCMADPISAAEAYDSFYQDTVSEALGGKP